MRMLEASSSKPLFTKSLHRHLQLAVCFVLLLGSSACSFADQVPAPELISKHQQLAEKIRSLGGQAVIRREEGSMKGLISFIHLEDINLAEHPLATLLPTEEVAKVWFGTQMVQEAEVKTLQQCRLLTELGLSMLVISDPLLAEVAKIKTLETLVLNTTPVSDAGIAHLQGHPALLSIRLGDTFVTTAGVRQLAQATPQLKGVTWSTVESEKMRQAIIGARNGGLMISRDVHSLRDLSTPGGPPPLNDPYRLFITRGWKPNEETREVFGVLGAPAPVSVNLNITDEAAWESLAFLPQIDELKIQLRKRASEATWSHLLEIKSLKRLSIPEGTPGAFLRQLSQVAGLQQLVVRKDALFFKDAPDIDALVQSGVKLERLELVGCNLTDKIITKIAAAKLTKEFVLRGCLGDSDEALQKARQLDPLLHIHRGDKPKKTTI